VVGACLWLASAGVVGARPAGRGAAARRRRRPTPWTTPRSAPPGTGRRCWQRGGADASRVYFFRCGQRAPLQRRRRRCAHARAASSADALTDRLLALTLSAIPTAFTAGDEDYDFIGAAANAADDVAGSFGGDGDGDGAFDMGALVAAAGGAAAPWRPPSAAVAQPPARASFDAAPHAALSAEPSLAFTAGSGAPAPAQSDVASSFGIDDASPAAQAALQAAQPARGGSASSSAAAVASPGAGESAAAPGRSWWANDGCCYHDAPDGSRHVWDGAAQAWRPHALAPAKASASAAPAHAGGAHGATVDLSSSASSTVAAPAQQTPTPQPSQQQQWAPAAAAPAAAQPWAPAPAAQTYAAQTYAPAPAAGAWAPAASAAGAEHSPVGRPACAFAKFSFGGLLLLVDPRGGARLLALHQLPPEALAPAAGARPAATASLGRERAMLAAFPGPLGAGAPREKLAAFAEERAEACVGEERGGDARALVLLWRLLQAAARDPSGAAADALLAEELLAEPSPALAAAAVRAALAASRGGSGGASALQRMGGELAAAGHGALAEACFVGASAPLAPAEGAPAGWALVGAGAGAPPPRAYASLPALLRTELYAWTCARGDAAASQRLAAATLPLKLLLAAALAERGLLAPAAAHCAAVAAALQQLGARAPPGLAVCRVAAADLADRLAHHAAARGVPLGGGGVAPAAAAVVAGVGKLLDKGIAALMGGGSAPHSRSGSVVTEACAVPAPAGGPDHARRASVALSSGPGSPAKGFFARVGSFVAPSAPAPAAAPSAPAEPAVLGERENTFYYDEALKIWRERGAPLPAPEQKAPPPPPLVAPPSWQAPPAGAAATPPATSGVASRYASAWAGAPAPGGPAAPPSGGGLLPAASPSFLPHQQQAAARFVPQPAANGFAPQPAGSFAPAPPQQSSMSDVEL
jgi:hypothetical protein